MFSCLKCIVEEKHLVKGKIFRRMLRMYVSRNEVRLSFLNNIRKTDHNYTCAQEVPCNILSHTNDCYLSDSVIWISTSVTNKESLLNYNFIRSLMRPWNLRKKYNLDQSSTKKYNTKDFFITDQVFSIWYQKKSSLKEN